MYKVLRLFDTSNLKVDDNTNLIDIDGFLMETRKKCFKINGSSVTKIKIVNKKFAIPIVDEKVQKKYNRLIVRLTDLLTEDDEDGESCREALNQIEKFRLEIKIKYRKFMKKKELEKMSKNLKLLQKEAQNRLIEIQNSYMEYLNENSHSK